MSLIKIHQDLPQGELPQREFSTNCDETDYSVHGKCDSGGSTVKDNLHANADEIEISMYSRKNGYDQEKKTSLCRRILASNSVYPYADV